MDFDSVEDLLYLGNRNYPSDRIRQGFHAVPGSKELKEYLIE